MEGKTSVKILRLSENRIGEVVSLANEVFRSNGGSMKEDYPLLFSKENAQNILCVEEEGKIVSIFGLLFREIQIFSARIKVSLAGAVCTDEKYRKRGYATRLMKEAAKLSVGNGASLILISGDNAVYKKFGAANAGIYFTHFVNPAFKDPSISYREATRDDLEFIAYLHSMDPVRFVRDERTFKTMLEVSKADNMPATIFISKNAYVAITKGVVEKDEHNWYHCVEHGGCQTDVADLVKSVAGKMNPMILHTTLADCVLNKIFNSEKSRKRGFIGTVKILDKELFLEQLKPYLKERAIKNVGEISDLERLTKYIFGSSDEFESLEKPLPLPDYGMDYV